LRETEESSTVYVARRGIICIGELHQKAGNAVAARIEFEKHVQIKERDRNAQYRPLADFDPGVRLIRDRAPTADQ